MPSGLERIGLCALGAEFGREKAGDPHAELPAPRTCPVTESLGIVGLAPQRSADLMPFGQAKQSGLPFGPSQYTLRLAPSGCEKLAVRQGGRVPLSRSRRRKRGSQSAAYSHSMLAGGLEEMS